MCGSVCLLFVCPNITARVCVSALSRMFVRAANANGIVLHYSKTGRRGRRERAPWRRGSVPPVTSGPLADG